MLPWAGLALFAGCLTGLFRIGGDWLGTPGAAGAAAAAVRGNPVVVIDPGHGGKDSGAIGQGMIEKEITLDVGLRVAKALTDRGCKVRLTRDSDRYVALDKRVQIANVLPGAVFVSIHFNDAQEGAAEHANGIETYYCDTKLPTPASRSFFDVILGRRAPTPILSPEQAIRAGRILADCVQRALIDGTGAVDRGVKQASLYVTHRVGAPAVLVEGGFVSHSLEARLLQKPAYRQKIAEAIAAGIVDYLSQAPAKQDRAGDPPRT